MPDWGFRLPSTIILPLPAASYEVCQVHPDWFEVRERDELIWSGIGPVSVEVSRTPF